MLSLMGLVCLVAGGAVSFAAVRHPAHQVLLQRVGGTLLVIGLAALGVALGQLGTRPRI